MPPFRGFHPDARRQSPDDEGTYLSKTRFFPAYGLQAVVKPLEGKTPSSRPSKLSACRLFWIEGKARSAGKAEE